MPGLIYFWARNCCWHYDSFLNYSGIEYSWRDMLGVSW